MKLSHTPVLLENLLELTKPLKIKTLLDATLGAAGHSKALLQAHPEVDCFVACDQDKEALLLAKEAINPFLPKTSYFFHDNFSQVLDNEEISDTGFDFILMDIGVSSMQIDSEDRGFSFKYDAPLDMRMNQEGPVMAKDIVNNWHESKLAEHFTDLEVPQARKVAKAICQARQRKPLETTQDLLNACQELYKNRGRIHPATCLFQALRILVNRELEVLETALLRFSQVLNPGGILAVITFHSLEDRIAKNSFRKLSQEGDYENLTKKPLCPSLEEVKKNPRARSSKLRLLKKQ